MCSNAATRLARIREAIDQLAAEAASAGEDSPDRASERLAAIWAMVAELDPGLTRRLRGYTDKEPGGRTPGAPGPGAQGLSRESWPSRAAAGGMDRKAEEE